jgi:hypothetical protein
MIGNGCHWRVPAGFLLSDFAALDPDRPQPRRLLALALARLAALSSSNAKVDLTRAVELLYGIPTTPLDGPWNGIEMIALDEANALLPQLHRAGGKIDMDPTARAVARRRYARCDRLDYRWFGHGSLDRRAGQGTRDLQ